MSMKDIVTHDGKFVDLKGSDEKTLKKAGKIAKKEIENLRSKGRNSAD